MRSNWKLEFCEEKINSSIESVLVNNSHKFTISNYLSEKFSNLNSIYNIKRKKNDLKRILNMAIGEVNKLGFNVTQPDIEISINNENLKFPIYLLKSNTIMFPISFLNFFGKEDMYKSDIIMFFLLHEFAHFIFHKHKEIIKIKKFFKYKYRLFKLYDNVFLFVNNRKIKLDLSRIINEIIPDFISIYLICKLKNYSITDINKAKKRFLSLMINPNVSNEEITEIFCKDKHAPIEVRISLSFKALIV